MAVPPLPPLRIAPDLRDPVLAQQQERFNALVDEVARWRAALAEWNERIERHHQAVEPVRRELQAEWRQWVFALDAASLQAGFTRGERAQLSELLRDAAEALLALDDDAEIAAVLRRHGGEQPASDGPVESPRDEVASEGESPPEQGALEDWERQAERAAARRAQEAARRRGAAAARKRQAAEREVSQSLRDVYRRLASVLHPDREPDARQRERKTALMQQANQAYADDNLLALLELQLQAEQIDADHLAGVDRRRLEHYATVLQEQLAELQVEVRRLESAFRAATGLPPGNGLQPRKADRTISAEAQRLRGELQLLRRQVRVLDDVEDAKAWLRAVRKA